MGGEGEESLEGASRAGSSEEEPAAPCARENEPHGRRPKLCRLRTEQPRDGKAETRHRPREPEVRLCGHARGNAEVLLDGYLRRNDPVQKAERAKSRSERVTNPPRGRSQR